MPDNPELIYKILTDSEWFAFQQDGEFDGSDADKQDGYIHFSSGEQVRETAVKHFSHLTELWLLTIDCRKLTGELKWEPSRGGALFPHLYAKLKMSAVIEKQKLVADPSGSFDFAFLQS